MKRIKSNIPRGSRIPRHKKKGWRVISPSDKLFVATLKADFHAEGQAGGPRFLVLRLR
jgi:hypothetical protein